MMRIRRLIPRSTLIRRHAIRLPPLQRALYPLILIRALLIGVLAPRGSVAVSLDSIAASTAAARAEHPEEARAKGESDGEPGGDVDAVAEMAVDVIFGEGVVKGAGEDGVEDGGREGEGEDEEGGDG